MSKAAERYASTTAPMAPAAGAVPPDAAAEAAAGVLAPPPAERLRGAPPHLGRRILEGEPQRGRGGRVADQPESERGHQPHLGLRLVGPETAREGLDRLREPDPTEREGGAPPNSRARIVEVGDELRLPARGRGGAGRPGLGAGPGAGVGAGRPAAVRRCVAQDAPILEAQDGRELLVRRRCDREHGRRPPGAGPGANDGADAGGKPNAGSERPGHEQDAGNAGGMAAGIGPDHRQRHHSITPTPHHLDTASPDTA